ncbi:elongation factor EF-1 gamma subunit [Friedmanniomyces endolithicus]|uniref:Elongation factor EF-1 gamma subunit n=1 Tax=Rachicladosporium monterosium TaxID=1507873 RepID=A0ABR0LDL3_9PEZI|nr:elongation factor EF-1 gamma subunit [Friedmanniomyces endolithicus]KAK5147255.1 elongation factor EF-1 gamma subunit [Rachicladosporium monterosium]
MAPFGKIYSYPGNPRTTAILAVAKANSLELEQVHTEPAKGVSEDYKKLNKLGKVPTFEGADGYVLTECMAIAIYITSQNEKTTLLGKTKQDYASILRWMSFANTECLPRLGAWFRPLIGRDPYNKKNVDDALPAFEVAPDVDSYEFKKLDPTKKEDKEFVDDMWSWDKPIEVEGKKYEWADGKVFK